jgi:gentisate 1,2-dioxygenase
MASVMKDPFHEEMERLGVSALWEQDAHGNRRAAPERAKLWRWSDMVPLIDHAVRAASMADTERRVLTLHTAHVPSLPTLTGALQILLPGEKAPPHRHSMNALRFVMEGSGATTFVDGKPCAMEEGDMVLTPGWTWHEHRHDGARRMVWFDCLDVPLHLYLNTTAFEPGPPKNLAPIRTDGEFASAGMVPGSAADVKPYSPIFRYAWSEARQALARMPPETDGSRLLHYVNPLNGGPVMSLLDCYLLEVPSARETASRWSTASTLCVVAEGEGSSRIGDDSFEWKRNDVFTVPRKTWSCHMAKSEGTKLFVATDRIVLEKLGLLQEQVRH